MENNKINLMGLVNKAVEWKKPLLICTLGATVIAVIISFLIAPQYKSTATVFPTRQFSVSKLIIEQNVGNQEDYNMLGDEDDAEKAVQLLTSETLKTLVADKFNLWERWSVPKDKFGFHNLRLKWDNMVKIKRTDYNSIKIEAYDYTANGAAQICNGILAYCDTVRYHMTMDMANKAFAIVKDEYENTVANMNEMEDSLQALRSLGILDYKEDVEAYTKSYAKALEKGNSSAAKILEEKLNNLKKYGGSYLHVSENLRKYRFKFPVIKAKYDEALVNKDKYIPFLQIVEAGVPDEFKARPIKSLIVLITFLSTFILTFIILMVKENVIKLKLDNG
jgi:LPS O-antigen subunit length determinant protein (WzzB/FepE family)